MVLKRKTSAHAVCIDPKKTNVPKKPPTKADLQDDLRMTKDTLKMTKELNDALLDEVKENEAKIEALENKNSKNSDIIKSLQEEVTILQSQRSSSNKIPKGAQTYTPEIQICCNLCIYVATCEEELNWHMGEDHDLSSDSYFDKDFYCEICSKWFTEESDLEEHVQDHKKPTAIEEKVQFYCNFCEETFTNKRGLMAHKKRKHAEKVTLCWKSESGICDFGEFHC